MLATRLGPRDLLQYDARYGVLICRECQYAIQKSAVPSHLLRHKIYRDERRLLLSSISQLDLLEPHLVPLPDSASPPIDGLPVISGYCCTESGCGNLCASSKRMRRHLSEVHGHNSGPVSSSSRPVTIQTFFRGTKLRYFEVNTGAAQSDFLAEQLAVAGDSGADDNEAVVERGHDEQVRFNDTATTVQPQEPASQSLGNLDLETLTYFHHFTTTTSLTLPEQATYWQTDVVLQALQQPWLMYGLLAISACHLATLTDNQSINLVHRRRSAQFWKEFSSGRDEATNRGSGTTGDRDVEKVWMAGERIRCVLHCALCALGEPLLNQEAMLNPAASFGLQSIVATIRVLFIAHDTLRVEGDGGDEDIQGEEIPERRDLKPPPEMLTRLHALPYRMAEVFGRPNNAQDVLTTLATISTLVKCCGISFAADNAKTAWRGMATWVAKVSDHFNFMITCHKPPALVVLAHWAAFLLTRAENCGCWFLKNLAKSVLLQVSEQLDSDDSAVRSLLSGL